MSVAGCLTAEPQLPFLCVFDTFNLFSKAFYTEQLTNKKNKGVYNGYC